MPTNPGTIPQSEKTAAFRALHEQQAAFVIANPFDIGSAVILEQLGFKALATTSCGHAWSIGKVDGRTSLDDKLRHCRELVAHTTVPISADLGVGFGVSPDEVAKSVHLAAETGLAGCSIEDASVNDRQLIEESLAVERVQAAKEAASSVDSNFVLTARCEGFVYGQNDLDQTVHRLRRFAEVGADVLYAPGMTDTAHIKTLCDTVDRPVNVLVGFRGMNASFSELVDAGVRRISVGSQLAKIAYGSFLEGAKELLEKGQTGVGSQLRSKHISMSILHPGGAAD